MPRFSHTIRDAQGRAIGVACGSRPRRSCSTPGCRNDATIQCDYGVTRLGRAATCDRWCCRRCAVSVGKDLDHCAVHARGPAPAARPAPNFGTPKSLEGVEPRLASGTLPTPRDELLVKR